MSAENEAEGRKPDRKDLIEKVYQAIRTCSHDEPARDMRMIGEAFIKIADTFDGVTRDEAKRAIRAAAIMHGLEV